MKRTGKEQQKAFRCFVRNTEKLIVALKIGVTLDQLAENCEIICGHSCTDGCETGICNVNRWIHILLEAETEKLIPTSTVTFLEYICEPVNPHRTFKSRLKHIGLRFLFLDFECVKSKIIEDLSDGFSLRSIITDSENYEDAHLLYGWATLLEKAKVEELIPGGDLLEFLDFI